MHHGHSHKGKELPPTCWKLEVSQSRIQSLRSFWQGQEAMENANEKIGIIMISVPVPYS